MAHSTNYGKTKQGKFVCRNTAVSMGAHAAKRSGMMGHPAMGHGVTPHGTMAPAPGPMPATKSSSGPVDRGQHGPGGAVPDSMASPGSMSSPNSMASPGPMPSSGPPDHGQHGPGGATSPAPQASNSH